MTVYESLLKQAQLLILLVLIFERRVLIRRYALFIVSEQNGEVYLRFNTTPLFLRLVRISRDENGNGTGTSLVVLFF